jgi:phospholipase A1
MFQSHGFQFFTTAWYRIPEAIKDDENRDVYRYLGYGEFEVAKSIGGHTLNFKTPIGSRHLSIDLKYSYPWKENLRWYLSVQTGHGHSLIEYNRSTQRFGIGFVLDSFIDRSIH